MSDQLDRIEGKLDGLIAALTNKERLGANAKNDGAAKPFQPAVGIERILGPKPEPQDSTKGTEWRVEAVKINAVLAAPPQEYALGVSVFTSVTDIVPEFFEYLGELKVTVSPGLPLRMHDADRFLPGNVAGMIRSVKGPQVP